MNDFSFNREIAAVADEVETVCRDLREELSAVLGDSDSFETELVLREVLSNSLAHGCLGDASKRIRVAFEISNGTMRCLVEDNGAGIFTQKLHEPETEELVLAENGNGLKIIAAYTDSCYFTNHGKAFAFQKTRREVST